MPYSGPGDLTPAPVGQDPTAMSGPVPIILNTPDDVAQGGALYNVDPSVYDPTRPVSADAIYVMPYDLGAQSLAALQAVSVPAPDSPTYASQVVIWGSNPGTPEEAVATYQAYDLGTASPSYGNTITDQLAYLPNDLVEGADPDPSYVPPVIDYHPPPSFHTDTTVSGGVTTSVITYDQPSGASVMDAAFQATDFRANPLSTAISIAARSVAPAISAGTKTTIPPVVPEDDYENAGGDYPTMANVANVVQGATSAADQYLAANYPEHAAKDNTWLYVLGGLALLMFLRR